jgi:hypothetical protein
MELKYFYLILAAGCVIWNVATSIRIFDWFRHRGVSVSFVWLRVTAPWYAHKYRKITREETGRTGALYYHWIISINSALVFALVAIVLHVTRG